MQSPLCEAKAVAALFGRSIHLIALGTDIFIALVRVVDGDDGTVRVAFTDDSGGDLFMLFDKLKLKMGDLFELISSADKGINAGLHLLVGGAAQIGLHFVVLSGAELGVEIGSRSAAELQIVEPEIGIVLHHLIDR